MKVLIRFRLIVLTLVVAVSLLVNVSLFTGNFYFERFNSLFATITRITPISYRDREEKRLVEKELESSKLALEKQYEVISSLNKEIEELSHKINKDGDIIKEINSENELLKGLVKQNEKLNEELREQNAELSASRLSDIIKENKIVTIKLKNTIADLNEDISQQAIQISDQKTQLEQSSQNLLVKDSRILDLKDRLDELLERLEKLENENARLLVDLERRKVKGY